MDSVHENKVVSAFQSGGQSATKMIATSSRPVRALMILLVLLLIYLFQPFTGNFHPGPLTTSPETTSAPAHPKASKDADASMAHKLDDTDLQFEATEAGPRIRKATMIYDTDKFNAVYERSVDSHIAHGKKWNNPTHILRHDVVDAGFFNKPAFLLGLVIQEMSKTYGQRADWIVWFDADTAILNPEVPWTIFLPPADFDDIHVLGSKDQNGFNAGMMLLRVHEFTVKMLAEVISLRQLRPEVEYPFYDQGATKWVLERPGYEEHLLYQPHDWWNAFGLSGEPYNTDRFMLHFAGVDCCGQPEKKTVVMGRWLDIVENHPEKHTTPLLNTTYPAQVEEYWKKLKDGKKAMQKAEKYKEDTTANRAAVENAQKELKSVMMREADNRDKVTEATKRLEDLIKPEAPKPQTPKADTPKAESTKAEPAKDEPKEETKKEESPKADTAKSDKPKTDSRRKADTKKAEAT